MFNLNGFFFTDKFCFFYFDFEPFPIFFEDLKDNLFSFLAEKVLEGGGIELG